MQHMAWVPQDNSYKTAAWQSLSKHGSYLSVLIPFILLTCDVFDNW